jgi:hypothetical protein
VPIRTYSELSRFDTFDERFEYLKLSGGVGRETFGFDRYLNQIFYKSMEWQTLRHEIIIRDNGCDLGIEGFDIHVNPHIHHMNPVTRDDILHHEEWILNPEYLILTTQKTHNAIHYGGFYPYPKIVTERTPRDTRLW